MAYRNKTDFIVLEAESGSLLNRDAVEGKPLLFDSGQIPANMHLPKDQNRSYEHGLQHRKFLAETGQIQLNHPKFGDETRPSFQAACESEVLIVYVGLTSYPQFMEDLKRRETNPALNLELQELGIKNYNDRWAYLQQAIGAMGLVMTASGSIVIAQRRSTGHEYDGFMDSAAGYVLFSKPTKENPNPVEHPEKLDPRRDVRRLVKREFGIKKADMGNPISLGFYGHPNTGEFDISYLLPVAIDDTFFTERNYPKDAERSLDSIVLLKGFDDVEKVLEGKCLSDKEFMYSTWGAMLALRPEDFTK